jgi:DNA repair exonuclease SbcCD ATPase subunit
MQEQSKAYVVNQPKIANINESWRDIEEERKRLKEREKQLKAEADKAQKRADEHYKTADKYYKEAEQLFDMATMPDTFQKRYNRMEQQIAEYEPKIKQLERDLSNSVSCIEHEKVVRGRNDLAIRISEVERELSVIKPKYETEKKNNAVLTAEIAEKDKLIDKLQNLCRDIYSGFANVIKSMKMLKNKKSKYYIDNISDDTSRLIDSVVDYSADWAKADGYPDISRDMRDNSEISEGIQKWIDEKTPKVKSRGMSI